MGRSVIFPNRFRGKVMIVTGAAQGIGRGVALRAAAEGAQVMLIDRATFVQKTAAEAEGEVAAFCVDLESHAGAEAAVAETLRRFGRVDILVNNVGGAIRMRPFTEFEPNQIEAEIRRTLYPTLWCCHAVLQVMLARRAGTIVNVSSNATRGIRRGPYSAAKGGVNALTQSLAMECAEYGVRVVATAPGGTDAPPRRVPRNAEGDTPDERNWMAEAKAQVIQSSFLKRYATLDEQVAPILFMASDEATYITGSVLPVAGGDLG
jgi:dihydroxycyclohexadiene carboxylate dehydrogenase